jgi:glutamyl-tRNA synthetase
MIRRRCAVFASLSLPVQTKTIQITLMDWGNAIVRSKTIDVAGQVTAIEMDLNLEGDFRKTKKKITWLTSPTSEHPLVPVTLIDYDYLITKKKLEETDDVADFVTSVTEFKEEALADANINDLKKGDIMQFERKGYFVFDGEIDGVKRFILVPDGRAASIASKAGVAAVAAPEIPKTATSAAPTNDSMMYAMERIYGADVQVIPNTATTMYKMDSVYK